MSELEGLSSTDLQAQGASALPTKEVLSLLDLNADVDLALDLAAPVDLAAAANLNVAAPIGAAASANVLSVGSDATALQEQAVLIDQTQSGDAIAERPADVLARPGRRHRRRASPPRRPLPSRSPATWPWATWPPARTCWTST